MAQALVDSGLRLGVHPGQSQALSLARAVRGARPAGPAALSTRSCCSRGEQACSLPWEHACPHCGHPSPGVCACRASFWPCVPGSSAEVGQVLRAPGGTGAS